MKNEKYNNILDKAIEGLQENIRGMQDISEQANTTLKYPFKDILDNMGKDILSFNSLQKKLEILNPSIEPVGLAFKKNIQETNLQMSKALLSLVPLKNIFNQFQEDQTELVNLLKIPIINIPNPVGIASIINQEFTFIKSAALMAQQSISRTNLQSIGELITPFEEARKNLMKPFTDMLDSNRTIWDTFYNDSQKILSVPLSVTKFPNIEVYLATHQVEVSTIDAELSIEEEKFICDIVPNTPNMIRIISSIDNKLIQLYEGAIKAIESDNVDRTRHATTSLRELFTHILHKLAPDKEFFKWNQDETNLYDNRPTRKGRLLYIYRNINHPPFVEFLNHDISAAISFLKLIQKGTHSIEKPYDDRQLKALLIRMESLIYNMIEISQSV